MVNVFKIDKILTQNQSEESKLKNQQNIELILLLDLVITIMILLPVQLRNTPSKFKRPIFKYVVYVLLFISIFCTFYGKIKNKPNLMRLALHLLIILQVITLGNYGDFIGA